MAHGVYPEASGTSDHGALTGLTDDDHGQYQLHDTVTFSTSGTVATATGAFRWYPPYAITLVDVLATVGTAPTGASLICDVHKSGTTVFTTQGRRPTIAASGNKSTIDATNGVPEVTSVATTDYLTVDVDQIGSTVAGANLLVIIRYKRT